MLKFVHSRISREIVQLLLVLLAVLVLFEDFVSTSEKVNQAAQLFICVVSAGLSVVLYQMSLKTYSFFFALSAFCFGPLFFEVPAEYTWIRPNVFIAVVSIFLFFVLQQYRSSLVGTKRKGKSHVRA